MKEGAAGPKAASDTRFTSSTNSLRNNRELVALVVVKRSRDAKLGGKGDQQ
jgi:hypothetical protein